jgi:hypothetical protein
MRSTSRPATASGVLSGSLMSGDDVSTDADSSVVLEVARFRSGVVEASVLLRPDFPSLEN